METPCERRFSERALLRSSARRAVVVPLFLVRVSRGGVEPRALLPHARLQSASPRARPPRARAECSPRLVQRAKNRDWCAKPRRARRRPRASDGRNDERATACGVLRRRSYVELAERSVSPKCNAGRHFSSTGRDPEVATQVLERNRVEHERDETGGQSRVCCTGNTPAAAGRRARFAPGVFAGGCHGRPPPPPLARAGHRRGGRSGDAASRRRAAARPGTSSRDPDAPRTRGTAR